MHIRAANQQDSHAIQELITTTFPKEENEIIAQLAADLLSETTTPATLSLVAVNGNRVVGYVAYSPLLIEGNDDFKGYILAPLGVSPDYQKRGVGSQLVETSSYQNKAVKL